MFTEVLDNLPIESQGAGNETVIVPFTSFDGKPSDTRREIVRNGTKIVIYGGDTTADKLPGRNFRQRRRR